MPSKSVRVYDLTTQNHPHLLMYAPGGVFTQLTTSWQVVLENDLSSGIVVVPPNGIVVCNNTNADRWFSLAVLDNNDVLATDSAGKRLYYETPLELADAPGDKGETYEVPTLFHLNPGERIVMQASANSAVNVLVNYLQQQ